MEGLYFCYFVDGLFFVFSPLDDLQQKFLFFVPKGTQLVTTRTILVPKRLAYFINDGILNTREYHNSLYMGS